MKIENLTEAAFLANRISSIDRNLQVYRDYHPFSIMDLLNVAKDHLSEDDSVNVEMQAKRIWTSIIELLEKRKEALVKQVEAL